MKKALILGALPSPGFGPWVSMDGAEWFCQIPFPMQSKIVLEVKDDGEITQHLPRGAETYIRGDRVRVVIVEAFDADVVNITMEKVA